jgi:hypothetical protein
MALQKAGILVICGSTDGTVLADLAVIESFPSLLLFEQLRIT